MTKIERFLKHSSQDVMLKTVYFGCAAMALFVHLVQLVFFIFMQVPPFIIWNALGIIFFALMFFVIKKEKYELFFILSHVDVTFYVIVAVILLGWDYGLQYAIFSLVALSYYTPYKHKYVKTSIAVIQMIVFAILLFFFYTTTPVYDLSHKVVYMNAIRFFNIMACLFVIFLVVRLSEAQHKKGQSQLKNQNTVLKQMVQYDSLTGLLTRKTLLEQLSQTAQKKLDTGIGFILIFGDIDRFKDINDTYGHNFGDYVLQQTALLIKNEIRDTDYAGRWGGEEFVIVLDNITLQKATERAEIIRKKLEQKDFFHNGKIIKVTITLGLAEYNNATNILDLIEKADQLMYIGKKQGRNKVVNKAR